MSVKRAFFGIFQKLTLFCCAIFFGITNTFAANLPNGYTQLEYIKSSNNAFLDTGYILQSDDIKYEWEAIDAAGSSSSLFGSETSTNPKYSGILHGSPSSRALYVGSSTSLAVGYTTDTTSFHSWVLDITSAGKASLYKDGTKTTTVNWTVPVQKSLSIYIFSNHSKAQYANNVSLKYFKITDNNVLKVNLVPAQRNSDSKIGMYDLVSNKFITNSQGSLVAGPVVLNPCRNLFDQSIFNTDVGASIRFTTFPIANGTYTISTDFPRVDSITNVFVFAGTTTSGASSANNGVSASTPRTITVTDGHYTIAYRSNVATNTNNPKNFNWQLESGSTATAYVPYSVACHNPNAIKIATTTYNTEQFSPVVYDLNTTVATIRSVVTNTINQTKAIADLQAKKQTRPDEQCPAGKKCLLVEDNDGVPHWYEIIENIYGLPAGYTPLEYIQTSGTQYIDTGVSATQNTAIETRFINLSNESTTSVLISDGWTSGKYQLSIVAQTNAPNRIGGLSNTLTSFWTQGRVFNVSMNKTGLYIDGSLHAWSGSSTNFTSATPLYLLGDPNASGRYAKAKLFYMKIYNNDAIVRDFVPAKRNSDGAIGMYDLTNPNPTTAFYTNKGSGTFSPGQEI